MPVLPSPIASPRKILVRGVNWLGDAVMTAPALQRLRERFPESQILMLGPRHLSELWLHHPSIHSYLTFERGESPWSIAKRLRGMGCDMALVLPNSPRSALEIWLSGIPQRLGFARPWRNWFLTQAVPSREGSVSMRKRSAREIRRLIRHDSAPKPVSPMHRVNASAHQIQEYLHLVGTFGANSAILAPKLEVLAEELQMAEAVWIARISAALSGVQLEGQTVWLGLCPSSAYGPAKCWPAERFAAVAREVSRRIKNSIWLVFGTTSEWNQCEAVVRLAGGKILNVAGQTSLRELMRLLKLCRVVLTNDSGPMHVAASLGTPVVVPFGSTAPELTGPGLPGDTRHKLLLTGAPCSPCFRRTCPVDFRCMTGIKVEQVVNAMLEALQVN